MSADCGATCEIGDQLAEGLKDIMFGLDLKKMVPGGGRKTQDKNDNEEGGGNDEASDGGENFNFEQDQDDQERLEALSAPPPPSSPSTSRDKASNEKASAGRSPKRSPRRIHKQPTNNHPVDDNSNKDKNDDGSDDNNCLKDKDKPPQSDDDDDDENEGGGDNEEREEDINQMLEDMEIPDFNLSVDFDAIDAASQRSGPSRRLSSTIDDYEDRIEREEVYSRRYRPNIDEAKELQELATALGATSSMSSFTSSSASNLYSLLNGNHSIILMRAHIGYNDRDCELILLSDGFVLAYRDVSTFNILGSRYETCHLWKSVDHVTTAKVGRLTLSFLKDMNENDLDLVASSDGPNVRTWFDYIEKVFVSNVMNDSSSTVPKDCIGWQYRLIHKPAYTAAVMSDFTLMGSPSDPARDLNTTDEYNESTPLHYAMQADPCDAIIIDALLRYGADPNKPDGDGRTAMYFAQRNHLDDIEPLLKQFGGKDSNLAEMELRGELFGGVEEAQKRTEERREKEQIIKDQKAAETACKAQSAQSQMSKNMAAMIERGEKIQEMDDKARQINSEAKDFGDMAKQLKRDMKNKKWYQL
mmetsp:Transcript_43547/g.105565  ORF Transcript_43547/g.105565 Transcript_43547/m.105565 type:complete len:585 (-) Transcript_43547:240-1994(-)